MANNNKEIKPGLIETTSQTIKRGMAIGFLALVGAAIAAPVFSEAIVGAGLLWASSDAVHTAAEKRRIKKAQY